jgi:hypothetical protein
MPVILVLIAILGFQLPAHGYTQVTISTGAPAGLEQQFLAATTAQFLGKVIKNPLASGTYSLILFGPNPAYNPPPTNRDLLNALVTVDSWTYVMGWSDGEQYERQQDMTFVGSYLMQCSTPTVFDLTQASTGTWNISTCQDSLATINNSMYQLNFDTPTVVPGGF